jgi:hypothetical protein
LWILKNPPTIHEKSVAHFTQKSQRFPSKSGFRFAELLCSGEARGKQSSLAAAL